MQRLDQLCDLVINGEWPVVEKPDLLQMQIAVPSPTMASFSGFGADLDMGGVASAYGITGEDGENPSKAFKVKRVRVRNSKIYWLLLCVWMLFFKAQSSHIQIFLKTEIFFSVSFTLHPHPCCIFSGRANAIHKCSVWTWIFVFLRRRKSCFFKNIRVRLAVPEFQLLIFAFLF